MKLNKETLKFIGGAIIVAAAGLIMFPGFLTVAFGLWRIFLVLLIAGGAALALSYATAYVKKQKKVKD